MLTTIAGARRKFLALDLALKSQALKSRPIASRGGAHSQGGTYLTLLNTVSNMGVILPKLAIFASIDWLSARSCVGAATNVAASVCTANHQQVRLSKE